MKLLLALISLTVIDSISCQTNPIIIKWIKSAGIGYKNFTTNIYKIEYSANYVYVKTNSIPTHQLGPWVTNPNDAAAQNYTFKFPLSPSYNTGTKVEPPLGHIGLWLNGVSIYNADDGQTYNNKGVWKRNAYIFEGVSFDTCKGHADGSSEYHQHVSSNCLYNLDSSKHSSLIGFAFDGYPVYGPYGYSEATNSKSSIRKINTSYKLRSITDRTTLANGTVLTGDSIGPTLAEYKLSSYLQDYEYSAGYGDLDESNGRYCVTPEYPSGTYAYFISLDSTLTPVYPFVVGPYYKGNVVKVNIGTGSGKISVTESTTVYYSSANSFESTLTFLIPLIMSSLIAKMF